MADTGIRVKDNGPLVVSGTFTVQDGEGNPISIDKHVVALCRCGHSGQKPFCDGSHNDAGFHSEVRAGEPGA